MRHESMAAATEESDITLEVASPIPADALRPRHRVVLSRIEAKEVEFEALARAAGFADMTELRDQCRPR